MYKSKLMAATITSVLLIAMQSAAYSAPIKWVSATSAIQNLEATLAKTNTMIEADKRFTQKQPTSMVSFPSQVPVTNADNKLYANVDKYADNGYVINVDASADCAGAHYCNTGSLVIQKDQKVVVDKKATAKTTLTNGIQGYFTHGGAKADYWPATIQWRNGTILYTLGWKDIEDKKAYIKMANSVIEQLASQKKK